MLYAIIATDVENSLENRLSARPARLFFCLAHTQETPA